MEEEIINIIRNVLKKSPLSLIELAYVLNTVYKTDKFNAINTYVLVQPYVDYGDILINRDNKMFCKDFFYVNLN